MMFRRPMGLKLEDVTPARGGQQRVELAAREGRVDGPRQLLLLFLRLDIIIFSFQRANAIEFQAFIGP